MKAVIEITDAIENDKWDDVWPLVTKDNVNYGDSFPIRMAVMKRRVPEVKKLLEHGADINVWGNHLLSTAVVNNDLEMVKVLLDAGIDCGEKTEPMENAIIAGNPDMINTLLPRFDHSVSGFLILRMLLNRKMFDHIRTILKSPNTSFEDVTWFFINYLSMEKQK